MYDEWEWIDEEVNGSIHAAAGSVDGMGGAHSIGCIAKQGLAGN